MESEARHPLGAIPDPANAGAGGANEQEMEHCNSKSAAAATAPPPTTTTMTAAYAMQQHENEQQQQDHHQQQQQLQLQLQQQQEQQMQLQPFEDDEYRDERVRGRPRHWSWEHFRAIGEPKPTTRRRPAQCLLCSLVVEDARCVWFLFLFFKTFRFRLFDVVRVPCRNRVPCRKDGSWGALRA